MARSLTTSTRSLTCALVLAGVLPGVLSGCSTNRPLPTVRADGERFYSTRQWEKAERDLAEVVTRTPHDNDARFKLGVAQMEQGKLREARTTLTTALDVDPLNDALLTANAEALYRSADREALTAFLQRAASERGRVSDYMRLGTYMAKIGHPDEAQQAFLTAARIDAGRSVEPQLALADFYKAINDRERTLRRLRMAYFLSPEDQAIIARIRELGEIPGPSFALAPEEMTATIAQPRENEVR